jgi:hypothetical protein
MRANVTQDTSPSEDHCEVGMKVLQEFRAGLLPVRSIITRFFFDSHSIVLRFSAILIQFSSVSAGIVVKWPILQEGRDTYFLVFARIISSLLDSLSILLRFSAVLIQFSFVSAGILIN